MTDKKYEINVVRDEETGDLVLDLGTELCEELGWRAGDQFDWTQNPDTGEWILTKMKSNDNE